MRNSMLTAVMPTATTAQINGNSESIDPIMSNIMTRRVLSGEKIIVNNFLIKDLMKLNLWNDEIRQ